MGRNPRLPYHRFESPFLRQQVIDVTEIIVVPAIRATFPAFSVRIRESYQLRALITPRFSDQRPQFSERHFGGAVLGTDSCLTPNASRVHREWVRRQ
jgi:hypothetical protein